MSADRLIVNGHFEVDPTHSLPAFDTPTATAYAVFSTGAREPTMFGLLCDPKLPLRPDVFRGMREISEPGLIHAVAWGALDWPATARQHPFLIYDQPPGGKVFETLESKRAPLSDDDIIKNFLVPVMAGLEALSDRGQTHRAIRPDNIYFADYEHRTMMLGDAASAPPGYGQPALFEPIEFAIADRAARGEATVFDDMFALGMTALCLLLGYVPSPSEDPSQILLKRMVGNSYSVAVAETRLQTGLIDLLRGLLNDSVGERWSLRDLRSWIDRRQLTPKQSGSPVRATRPLIIAGTDYEIPRAVAHCLSETWADAGQICRSADFANWLHLSLDNDEINANVLEAVGPPQSFKDIPASDNDKLVTNLCIALDRESPIRHRGFAAHLEGVGTALATYFDDDDRLSLVKRLILGRFVNTWMALQPRSRPELLHLFGVFEGLPSFIEHNEWSEGIERCLYELNPSYHCRSPLFETLMVYRPEEILTGLDRVAADCDQTQLPIDRHIAAFLAARVPMIDFQVLKNLGSLETSRGEAAVDCLAILADLQKTVKGAPVPNLAMWFASLLEPAIEKFKNIKRRAAIAAEIKKVAGSGQLEALLALVEDQEAQIEDRRGFDLACQEYSLCTARVGDLESILKKRGSLSHDIGEQAAAIIAGIIGSVGASTILIWAII